MWKAIIPAIGLLGSSPALAENWVLVGISSGDKYREFVDIDNVDRLSNGDRTVLILYKFTPPMPFGQSLAASAKLQSRYLCSHNQTVQIQNKIILTDGTETEDAVDPNPDNVQAGSMDERVMQYVCNL